MSCSMPASAADFAPVRFSTDDLPERDRLTQWREEFGRGLVRVEIEPLASDRPFRAEATLQALPGVRTALCIAPAFYNRTRAIVAGGDDSIGLVINLKAEAAAFQRGKDVVLAAGDAVPILSGEPAGLTSTCHVGLLFPRAALASRVDRVEDAAMRVIPHATEPLRLLVSYLTLVRQEFAVATPELRRAVVDHIHDLAALTLGANRDTRASGLSAVTEARLTAALAHIADKFSDPGLTVDAVARRQGVSPRYLQRLLETSGTSFTARVTELRLQRAFDLLSRVHRNRRISDIAMEAGFSDVSNFNRLFRARFGDTPTGVRSQR
jgi:AraC-like DNA-binding protein